MGMVGWNKKEPKVKVKAVKSHDGEIDMGPSPVNFKSELRPPALRGMLLFKKKASEKCYMWNYLTLLYI